MTEYGFLLHRCDFKDSETDLLKWKKPHEIWLNVMLPRLSSHPPVPVTVVSVKRETLMSLWPFISIMHHLTAVGFIFTATSLCALGIKSKCCDQSHQLVEQTATAHRAEQAVSSKSQLIFSCNSDYMIYLFFLHGFFICTVPSVKDKCYLFSFGPIRLTGSLLPLS